MSINQTLLGLLILLVGFGLIHTSKSLGKASSAINKRIGTSWPLKWYRIRRMVVGILWMVYGLLVMLGFARIPIK